MNTFIRFPTGTRFGWLGFLVLTLVFAALEDVVLPHNGVLGRILGLLGLLTGMAGIIEFILGFNNRAAAGCVTNDIYSFMRKKRSLPQNILDWGRVGLLIFGSIVLLYLIGASL